MREPHNQTAAAIAERLGAARARAALTGRRIAVIFGADWCADSNALEAALAHYLVEPIVESGFVVVWVDVGNRDRHLDLMASYGMSVEPGLPAVAILAADGRLLEAQTEGEFRNARALTYLQIASFFHRWLPQSVRNGGSHTPVASLRS